ncbi:cytochrome b/b6 domain-containing protein [Myxococcota bacterium]|nr:cytochrome b/b6 domain-containing protein [Myxococcota bacterium]
MTRVLVWDVPTRLFHWLLAGAFLPAFVIALTTDDDGRLFPVHMLLGLVAAFIVGLRLLWGVVGSRPSRLSSFALRPSDLWAYARGAITGGARRLWTGHNPGASWAALVMFACVVGLAASGILMSRGVEAVEEVHEVLAWTLMGTVGVHLAGIVLHTLREREVIALSMLDGRRVGAPGDAIASPRPIAGLAFLALTGAWTGGLVQSYDPATSSVVVPVIGAQLLLGEGGEGGEGDDHEDEDEDD